LGATDDYEWLGDMQVGGTPEEKREAANARLKHALKKLNRNHKNLYAAVKKVRSRFHRVCGPF
jgi:hypothetical protein